MIADDKKFKEEQGKEGSVFRIADFSPRAEDVKEPNVPPPPVSPTPPIPPASTPPAPAFSVPPVPPISPVPPTSPNDARGKKKPAVIFSVLVIIAILVFAVFWYLERDEKAETGLHQDVPAVDVEETKESQKVEEIPATVEEEIEEVVEEDEEILIQEIKVKEMPYGWLNVRSSSDAGSPLIGKIYSDENYPFLEEMAGWYKIELSDGIEGWVLGDFAEIISE